MRVLACDDEEVVLKLIEVALKGRAEVTTARDGHRALEILRKEPAFDLIITDIHMPYYKGEDVLHVVRDEQKRNTPIIMLSSDGEEEVIAFARKQGVNDFIVKPIDAQKLLRKVLPYIGSNP